MKYQGVFVSGISYSWEGRSLIRYFDNSVSPNLDVGYAYNESGLRIRKTVNGVEHSYEYDGDRLVYEHTSNTSLRFIYDERGLLASLLYNTNGTWSRYHYVRDVTLNIFGLTDDVGNLVVRYTYDAWGNILSITGSMASTLGVLNPFRYKGYYYDSETGMYYCQTRYYVPQWCRWLSADSPKYLDIDSPEGINLFAYCGNNPVKYADATGHYFWIDDLVAAAAGLVIGLVGQFIGDIIGSALTGRWQFSSWEMYVGAGVGGALGGWLSIYNPAMGASVGAGVATFIGMGLERVTGKNQWSIGNIIGMSFLSAGIAGLTAGLAQSMNIAGITSGSHSFQQVYKLGIAKALAYGYEMSMKTIAKGFVMQLVIQATTGWLANSAIQGFINGLGNLDFDNERRSQNVVSPYIGIAEFA